MSAEVQVYSITDEYMESRNIKTLLYELIENLIYFLCSYPIVAIINHIYNKNESMLYLNLLMICPIFVMTYFRVKIKTMVRFILGIALIMVVSLSIIGLVLKQYIFIGLLIVWAIDCIKKSIYKQRVRYDKVKLIIAEAFLIPQIIIAAGLNLKAFQIFISIISIIIMLLSIGYICKARNVRLSMDDMKNGSFNEKDNNIFIAGIVLLIIIILLALFIFGTFDAAYNLTKKAAYSLLNIGNVSFISPSSNSSNLTHQNKNDNSIHPMMFEQAREPGKFAKIVLMVLNILLDAIFVIAIIAMSYFIINRILIYLKMLRNKENITFVYNSKEYEVKKKINKIRSNISKVIFVNNREKVRKLYKERILKYKKQNINVNNYFSTNDIQKEVFYRASDNIEELTKVYEKARYSNEDITQDDIDILKCKKKNI